MDNIETFDSNVDPMGYRTCPKCQKDYQFPIHNLQTSQCPHCGAPAFAPPPDVANVAPANVTNPQA